MRLKVGRIVDVSKDVNLLDLKPMERIVAAARNAYENTSYYRRRVADSEEAREEKKLKIRMFLQDNLLAVLQKVQKDFSNKQVSSVLLKVPSKYEAFIDDVLASRDFSEYDVTVIHPRYSASKYCSPPILVYVRVKEVVLE